MPLTQVPALRYWRARRRLSQGALAEQANISADTVIRLERGRPTRLATVRCLAAALNVVPGALMRPPPGPVADGLRPHLATIPALRYWRSHRLLTQEVLADRVGLSCQTLHALEHGGRARVDTVHRLAKALDVAPATLLRQPPGFDRRIVTPPAC